MACLERIDRWAFYTRQLKSSATKASTNLLHVLNMPSGLPLEEGFSDD